MSKPSRRALLKNAAQAAAVTTAGAFMAEKASAQSSQGLTKRSPLPPGSGPAAPAGGGKPLFSSVIAYGNLIFLAGVGAHFEGTIQQHTDHVLDQLEKTLVASGSSLQKVLQVRVFLNDLKDYDAMNAVYGKRDWGSLPPVRTTVAPAGGVPGKSLVEIDMIAYI
jgi:2-iminobutanoate/2-iminopropanoate deaminase